MSHVRHRAPGEPPVYRMRCDWPGCTQVHEPDLRARTASDARYLAQRDGWKAPNSARIRARRDIVDLCPAHRGATR